MSLRAPKYILALNMRYSALAYAKAVRRSSQKKKLENHRLSPKSGSGVHLAELLPVTNHQRQPHFRSMREALALGAVGRRATVSSVEYSGVKSLYIL